MSFMRICRGVVQGTGVGLLTLAMSVASVTTAWTHGSCVTKQTLTPAKIAAGQKATVKVKWIPGEGCNPPADEMVDISVFWKPTSGGSWDYSPKQTLLSTGAVVTISTSTGYLPGDYEIVVTGYSYTCGYYREKICGPYPLTVTAAEQAVPVNFEQVGKSAQPGAVLHFDYAFESSSGDLADLANCKVGEHVKYPGAGGLFTWPSPPWNGWTDNPTIIWVPAIHGRLQDDHTSMDFLQPYKSAHFSAWQKYRYKCKGLGTATFPGWDKIEIIRRVRDTTGRGCWKYKIEKSNLHALRRLPGVDRDNCTALPQTPVARNLRDVNRDNGEIAMSLSPHNTGVVLHEPVLADLTIVNRGRKQVGLDLGLNKKANLQLTIETPDGNVETRRLRSEGFGLAGGIVLAPGEAFKQTLLINEWFGFPGPGTYRVTMTLLNGSSAVGAAQPSATYAVPIGPANVRRLQTVANELADKAIRGATYVERMEAANALSVIDDPVAVDSLVRVLRSGALVEDYAVRGLGRVGIPRALAALTAAAHSHPDEDIRAAASSTLRTRAKRGHGAPRHTD